MPMARWFSTFLVVLSCLVAAAAAPAQPGGSNTYAVEGVDVDVTAADAIQARQQAMREAQRRAIRTLAERLVAAEDRAKIPPVDDAQLDRMIRGIEFARERTLANRYIATLNVVFNADAVK